MSLILMISIGVLILLMLILFFVMRRRQKQQMNYRMFFIIGITWLPLGIATQNYVFSLVGACFFAFGLANRKKWTNQPKWSELSAQERKLKLFVAISLAVLLLIGIAAYVLARQDVINF